MTTGKGITQRNTSVITQSQAMYLLKTIWPGAPETEVIKAAILCRQYNLNPLMRQVYLVQFGKEWVTILGIKATRQIAQQALRKRGIRYSYLDGPRVMSEKEQMKLRGKVEPDKIWAITIIKDSFDNTYPGYGFWPANKQPYGVDKGNDALNMAFIRSERNALDKLAPGELPDVDTGDESYVVGDFKAALAEGKQQVIDVGEQDIEAYWGDGKIEPTEATTQSSMPEKSTPEASGAQTDGVEQTSRIDLDWLKETLEIINWHRSDYKTARSWINIHLKAPVEGIITEVVDSLDNKQLKVFSDHIQTMRENVWKRESAWR